jgi:hypothetical protein
MWQAPRVWSSIVALTALLLVAAGLNKLPAVPILILVAVPIAPRSAQDFRSVSEIPDDAIFSPGE